MDLFVNINVSVNVSIYVAHQQANPHNVLGALVACKQKCL